MDISETLKNLKEGGLPFIRKEAAFELSKLNESTEDIVTRLLIAKSVDSEAIVREAAELALSVSVHKQIIENNPEIIKRAEEVAIWEKRHLEIENEKHQSSIEKKERRKKSLLDWGLFFIISGVVALILPVFDLNLLLFRIIPITHPLMAIGIIIPGIILVILRLRYD
jgi:hypothetical protein